MRKIKAMRRGFTLIELMVVIAIIAILTAIITANFSAAKSKSRDGQRISDVAQIQLALAGYFNQCNQYPKPDTISGQSVIDNSMITPTPQSGGCTGGINLSTFISKIPTPPSGANQSYYTYVVGYLSTDPSKTTPIDYIVEATLENNSTVSSESITSIPSDISTGNYACNATIDYCVGPK